MRFDVRPILHAPGKRLTFQFSLDLSDVEFAGRHPISRPVEVEGAVSNTADLLELELTARTTLDAVCDRCGKAFLQDKTVPFRCLLAEELQNEDNDEIVIQGTAYDGTGARITIKGEEVRYYGKQRTLAAIRAGQCRPPALRP